MTERTKSYSYEGAAEFWDSENFDGGRYFWLGDLHGAELDQEIADALGIRDRDRVNIRVMVEIIE